MPVADFRLELEGFDELQRKLGKRIDPYVQAMTMGIGEALRADIARYPGPSHSPVIWASAKQRRWWFAARRSGDKSSGLMGGIRRRLRGAGLLKINDALPPYYTRNSDKWSQRLEAGWTTKADGRMNAVVGNKATYGARVQSAAKQTAQHRASGWITDEKAIDNVRDSGIIPRLWKDTVDNIFER